MSISNAVKNADIRVNLILVIISITAVIVSKDESTFIALFFVAILWQCLSGKYKQALSFIIAYALLSWLSSLTIGVKELTTLWMFSIVIRHMFIPIIFVSGIMNKPTGSLIATFSKMHLPKALSIGTVVLFRFFPTIWEEFRAIQISLKFRGIGVSVISVLMQPLRTCEYILIPMLIRTTTIAEELSAAAIVRGVRLNNDITSFEPVEITKSDIILGSIFGAAIIIICALPFFIL